MPGDDPRPILRLAVFVLACAIASGPRTVLGVPGDLDPTFTAPTANVLSFFPAGGVAVQGDGKVVIAGTCFSDMPGCPMSSPEDFAVARLLSDGSLDTSFGSGGITYTDFTGQGDIAGTLLLQPDGRIVVVGTDYNHFALARYDTAGALDPTFGTGGKTVSSSFSFAGAGLLQNDGKFLVGGGYVGGHLERFASDGTVDTSFGTGGIVDTSVFDSVEGLAQQPDGKILVATSVGGEFPDRKLAVARLNGDGSLDSTFGTSGIASTTFAAGPSYAVAVILQPDNTIVAGGAVFPPSPYGFALARFEPDGTLDPSFGTNGQVTMFFDDKADQGGFLASGSVGTLLRDADGMLLAVGNRQSVRFRADGGIDVTFGIGGHVSSEGPRAALQPDGRFLVAGQGVERREGVCAPSGDADGDGIPDVCDPCVGGVSMDDVQLSIRRLSESLPNQVLSARGRLTFPIPPMIDPVANGMRMLLRDATGGVLFDVYIPGGPFGSVDGWTADAAHTRFRYNIRPRHSPIRGIRTISLTRADNVVRFRVAGKNSDYRVRESALPLSMSVVLDPPRAAAGICGETVLTSATCVFEGTGNGRRIVCR